jgi:hypothetical protein
VARPESSSNKFLQGIEEFSSATRPEAGASGHSRSPKAKRARKR